MTATGKTRNFSIFGSANAGKSTLTGYMHIKTSGLLEQWTHELEKIKSDLGHHFDHAQRFAYVVDTGKEERRRSTEKQGLGTSKELHASSLNVISRDQQIAVNIIDTPGAPSADRQRTLGMYWGECGIFAIEAKKLLDRGTLHPENLREFIAPLLAWTEFKSSDPCLVILSKFDLCEFSEACFMRSQEILVSILGSDLYNSLSVIPTCIDVAGGTDDNVLEKSIKMPWYQGETVLEWIEGFCSRDQFEKSSRTETTIFCADSTYPRQAEAAGVQMIVRGKLLRGTIDIHEDLVIAPVRYPNGRFSIGSAKVRSMRTERGDEVDRLFQGEIGGLGLTTSRSSKGIELVRTSCVFSAGTDLTVGSALEVSPSDSLTVELGEAVSLIYFGKIIDVLASGLGDKGGYVFVAPELHFALEKPFDSNPHEYFYIRKRRSGAEEFFKVRIVNIGEVHHMKVGTSATLEYLNLDDRILRRGDFSLTPDGDWTCDEFPEGANRQVSAVAEFCRANNLPRKLDFLRTSIVNLN